MTRSPYLSLFLSASAILAAEIGALQPQGYVNDFAGVVDQASRQEIEAYCAAVEKATGAQLAFVTIASLDGEPAEDVANTLFRKWGVGKKGENNGALLLLSVNDRRSRLEVGYGLEPYLPDGYAGSLLREMRPALRAGHYGEAFRVAAHQIGERIAQAKGVRIGDGQPLRRRIADEPDDIPWPLIALAVIVLVILLTRGGAGPWWWMMGNMMGRGGWHGSSRGGFGGYDSGGGFGGFGGGDSGGGGASSDW